MLRNPCLKKKEAHVSLGLLSSLFLHSSHVPRFYKPVMGKHESHGQNSIVLYALVHKSRYYLHGWILNAFCPYYFIDLFTCVNDIHFDAIC